MDNVYANTEELIQALIRKGFTRKEAERKIKLAAEVTEEETRTREPRLDPRNWGR
jgi:hypothetical protein